MTHKEALTIAWQDYEETGEKQAVVQLRAPWRGDRPMFLLGPVGQADCGAKSWPLLAISQRRRDERKAHTGPLGCYHVRRAKL